ncbi:tetratricopeptide repeat protein 1 [Cocos nucifera]|uniref:Tetratricopeptide repeat protein 1 n=1 Tax=Cocos nucifera TaxID=13894 RepID=A0A8K0HSR5_COCNU|nr:tetratricopeptide repeat protein 1 [Cocos nucifera]
MVVIEPEVEVEESKEAPVSRPESRGLEDSVVPSGEGAGSEDEAFEDALTDEQLKEKALNQANDAKEEGNKLFKAGQYENALMQYDLALQVASEVPSSEVCSMCHANRAVCFLKLNQLMVGWALILLLLTSFERSDKPMLYANATYPKRKIAYISFLSGTSFSKCFSWSFVIGAFNFIQEKFNDTIKECTKALELNPSYVKALFRRAEAHEKLEHYEEAIADWKKVMELDPSNDQARRNIRRLEPVAAEKREKMKEEMIGKLKEMGNSVLGRFGMSLDNFKAVKDPNTGKLKEMGNSVLGRFGMSLDNFKAVKDPNTGSYSVQFQR